MPRFDYMNIAFNEKDARESVRGLKAAGHKEAVFKKTKLGTYQILWNETRRPELHKFIQAGFRR